jgi:spore cortex formation protein SpoVR/YcgB (stage V sporulation)
MNPYYLGFEMFQDIRRICTDPTEEDKEWFPDLIGRDWLEVCLDAVANYRDESFIRQFLSPHLMRKLGLFLLLDDARLEQYRIDAIHDSQGYKRIRSTLAEQYELEEWAPKIEVTEADVHDSRTLTITYYRRKGRSLDESWLNMVINIKQLWGHKVILQTSRGNVIGEDG